MDNATNYRTPLIIEPVLSSNSNIMRTPLGNVHTTSSQPPALPPSLNESVDSTRNYGIHSSGYGNFGNSYNSYGANFGGYNTNPFGYPGLRNGIFGGGMFNNGFDGYNAGFNNYPGQHLSPYGPENRFIQLAQENTRPAFESIGSLVAAFANIAAMLDSTFYAITSSFHAILGIAENFGRLRGVFSQFWQTFAIFRSLTWIYKKLLYWMKISNIDPSSQVFKEAFAAAKNGVIENYGDTQNHNKSKRQSPWPVVIFLSFIFSAPYIVLKLVGNLTASAIQETKDPRHWVKPIKSVVLYDFQARTPDELTIKKGQIIYIAPKEIQNSQKLLNSGWAIATVDTVHSGLIPITYCKKAGYDSIEEIEEKSQKNQTLPTPEPSEIPVQSQIIFNNEILADSSNILEK